MATNVGSASVTIIPTMSGFAGGVAKEFGAAGSSAGVQFTSGVNKGLGGTGAITGKLAAIGGAAMAVAQTGIGAAMNTISSSVSGAVSRVDTLNAFPKVLQGLGYSAEDASAAVNKMSDHITGLPTTLDAIAGSVQQVLPSVGNVDKATNIMLAFNDALVAGGQSTQVQEAALQQFTQILAKGKPELEDWKSIQTAMPGQLDQVAKSMLGASADSNQLYEALKNGTVSMDDFTSALVSLDSEGYGGFASFADQAKAATDGIKTSFTNMQTAVIKNLGNVISAINNMGGSTGFIAGVIQRNTSVINAIGTVATGFIQSHESEILKAYNAISDILNAIGRLVVVVWHTISDTVGSKANMLYNIVLTVANGIGTVINGLASVIAQHGNAFKVACGIAGAAWTGFHAVVKAQSIASTITSFATTATTNIKKIPASLTRVNTALTSVNNKSVSTRKALANIGTVTMSGLLAVISAVVTGIGLFLTKTETGQQILSGLKSAADTVFGGILTGLSGAANAFSTVIGAGGNAATSLTEKFAPIAEKIGGFFSQIGPVVGQALGNTFQTVAPVVESLMGTLGAAFQDILPHLQPLLDGFNTIKDAVISFLPVLVSSLMPVVTQLIAFLAQLAPVLLEIGTTILDSILAVLPSLAEVISSVVTTVLPILLQLIQTLLPLLMQVITTLLPPIISLVTTVLGLFAQIVAAILPPLISLIGIVINVAMQIISAVLPVILQLIQTLMPIIADLINTLLPVVVQIIQAIAEVITALMPIIQEIITNILPIVVEVVNAIISVIQSVLTILQGIITFITGVFSGDWSMAWDGIKQIFSGVWDLIKSIVKGAINIVKTVIDSVLKTIKTIWDNIWNGIKDAFNNIWNGIKDAAKNGIDAVYNTVIGIKDSICNFFSGAGQWLVDSGKAILEGLGEGIQNAIGGVKDIAEGAVSTIRNLFPFSPAKEGPFAGHGYTTYSGRALITDFAKGAAKYAPQAQRTISKALNSLVETPSLNLNASTSASGYISRMNAAEFANTKDNQGVVINLNGATLNDDSQMQSVALEFMQELLRINKMRKAGA